MGEQNNNKSFLDKFQGRTNKIGKSGMQSILTPNKLNTSSQGNNDNQEHIKEVDLDVLIPSNPGSNSRQSTNKRKVYMARPPIKKNPQKQEYTPSTYTPQTNSSKDESLSNHPPTRSLSNSTENSRGKYVFGKYLKLDKQAIGHMQFMQFLQEKSLFKKSIRNQSIAFN